MQPSCRVRLKPSCRSKVSSTRKLIAPWSSDTSAKTAVRPGTARGLQTGVTSRVLKGSICTGILFGTLLLAPLAKLKAICASVAGGVAVTSPNPARL